MINTPLAFLIKSALNSNIFGEPGWMGTGWRAGRDLQRHGHRWENRDHQQLEGRLVLRLRTGRGDLGLDRLLTIIVAILAGPPPPERLKIRSLAMKAVPKAPSRPGTAL
ncbi:hypothetical protein LN650_03685 [Klebsiella pneumoniae subsp. pneumoniae]|nr:hypothetical protein [Klebsiella pneumoniae subsp. pneumoniae]